MPFQNFRKNEKLDFAKKLLAEDLTSIWHEFHF